MLEADPDSDPLVADVARYVEAGEGDFDDLARRVCALQFERVTPIRRLCEARGVRPGDSADDSSSDSSGDTSWSWRRMPPVPTSAFRSLPLHVAEPREVFRSSGTTGGAGSRSVHRHPFPDLYRTVIDASFPAACLPAGGTSRRPILSLVPSRDQVPDSSLGFMCDHILRTWGSEGSRRAFGDGGVDVSSAAEFLRRFRDRPVTLLTTAFALAQLLDELDDFGGFEGGLAPGSTMMETGGFKGRRQEVTRAELLARLEERLGLPPERVVREYGMTELTGHVYSGVLRGGDPDVFLVPRWMRVRLLDPETLEEVPAGEEGLVSFFDLSNVGSAAAVVSQDLGVAELGSGPDARPGAGPGEGPGEGPGAFRLLGRAPGSDLRGCSLVVEEARG